jgi:hypothetical protein
MDIYTDGRARINAAVANSREKFIQPVVPS